MSLNSLLKNADGYALAFQANDITSEKMRKAIAEWFSLYYQGETVKDEDSCQQIPYTIVRKLTKTVFAEYEATSKDAYTDGILASLAKKREEAMQAALIGGLSPKKERAAMAGDYFILQLEIPSVLVECGFVSNAAEERLLRDAAYQERLAEAIAAGVEEYVRLMPETVGRLCTGYADAAQVQRVVPGNRSFARLCLAEGDVVLFCDVCKGRSGLRVPYPAAQDQQRLPAGADHLYRPFGLRLSDQPAIHVPDPLAEEIGRIIVGLSLNVLAQREADRPGIRRVSQDTHRVDGCAHDLLRTLDAVVIAAHGTERIVHRRTDAAKDLRLLQDRIRLPRGEGIPGQGQEGDPVGCRAGCGGHHVGRPRPDGRDAGDDLLAVVLLGIGDSCQAHTLLVLALVEGQIIVGIVQCLSDADDAAVSEDTEDTLNELGLLPILFDVLLIQEPHQRLGHGQSYSLLHLLLHSLD